MKIVSLWNPWASLLAAGHKRIETRSWPIRGPFPLTLAIHAAKRFTAAERSVCLSPDFVAALNAMGYERLGDVYRLPLGCVVGVVTVTRVYQFIEPRDVPPRPERSFGDYGWRRWGWVTEDHRLLAEPIPLVGHQGVWDWDPPADLRFAGGGRVSLPPAPPPAQLGLFAGVA